MKISLDWISDYIDLPDEPSPADLAHELTLKTVEVEEVVDLGDALANVVVGVIESVKQIDAKRQSVVVCWIGENKTVTVVSASPSLAVGMTVAVALPGARLAAGGSADATTTVAAVKVAGRRSEGVICTPANVRLQRLFPDADAAAALDLSDLAPPAGTPLARVVGFDDVILEIDNKSLTNRPDLWGHYGIARELATIYNLPLRPLPTAPRPSTSSGLVGDVDGAVCDRFAAVSFELDDATRAAPLWLRSRLARIGEATVDLCVDVSNYVMFTVGQPIHVYDADQLEPPLSVRTARDAATLGLLDGSTAQVAPGTPVIADAAGPVGIAGIMGGARSAVSANTRRYVLEAATFRPQPIRRASQQLALRTEASARFEKALDTPRVDAAIDLFLQLLQEVAPSATVTGMQDITLEATAQAEVNVGLGFLTGRIGAAIELNEIERTLDALGFAVTVDGDVLRIAAPTWRSTGDISLPHDIVEEIARIHGYDNLPTAPLAVALRPARALAAHPVDRVVREILATRMGMQEVLTYPWVTDGMLAAAGLDKAETVRFEGAPAPDRDSLRPSLVPNLLEAATANLRYASDVEIFEVGRVFRAGSYVAYGDGFEPMPRQALMLAAIMTGSDGAVLFRRAKGMLEQLSRVGHLSSLDFGPGDTAAWADASARVVVTVDGAAIGTLGLLTKRVRRLAGLDTVQAACLEIDLGGLSAHTSRNNTFEALSDFPEADFDLSVVADDTVPWAVIAEVATQADPLVHRVVFVDEFRGSWVADERGIRRLVVEVMPAKKPMTRAEADAQFDDAQGRTFSATGLVKQARLVEAGADYDAEWGERQHFPGRHYVVVDEEGTVKYGSEADIWERDNERVPGTEGGWRKMAAVDAYQHRGEPKQIVTVLRDGTVETPEANTAREGDWIVRQKDCEIMVVTDEEFRQRYDADTPKPAGKDKAAEFGARVEQAATGREDALRLGLGLGHQFHVQTSGLGRAHSPAALVPDHPERRSPGQQHLPLGVGHRSVTFRVTLRPLDTTLTAEMIGAARSRVIAALAERTGAHLRE